jgi:hypothetical protein
MRRPVLPVVKPGASGIALANAPPSLWPLPVAAICVSVGFAVAQAQFTVLATLPIAAAAAIALRWNRGVAVGVLALLVLNGLPFVNLRPSALQGSSIFPDFAFVLLVTTLAFCWRARPRDRARESLLRLASIWSMAYVGWWTFKILLTVTNSGVPAVPAITYGRDFAYFGLLLPLGLAGLRDRRHLTGFAFTLAAGASLYSLGQIAYVATGQNLSWLFHVGKTADFDGVVRLYAPMNDLLIAALPMAVAVALLGPSGWRRYGVAVGVVTGVANALSFTRAVYVGEAVALVVISVIWALGTGWGARRVRAALLWAGLVACLGLTLGGTGASSEASSASPVQAIVARADLGIADAQGLSGSFGYRLRQVHRDFEVLGSHWLTGLGFLSPKYRYFGGLREGSIRDSDLGSLNIVMTMGVIGLILAYLPPVSSLVLLLRRRDGWWSYGGAMYLTAALIGSLTLGTLSSVSGLLVLVSALIIVLNWQPS